MIRAILMPAAAPTRRRTPTGISHRGLIRIAHRKPDDPADLGVVVAVEADEVRERATTTPRSAETTTQASTQQRSQGVCKT
jgi:hypothetical protein